ncbi:MAG: hypothetical protein E7179_06030 [Erysipelotrichaceae bacterium]|nr:hypothetical protein [Erysipelotrichaceae bacterium]
MISRKLKTIGALCACSVTAIAVVFASGKTFGAIKASGTEKTFSFDKDVASQVPYDGAYQWERSVTTGISTPILTRFYRSEGKMGEDSSRDGCFCSFGHAIGRTHVFEAGVNNLTAFEYQFHAAFNLGWDNKFDATLTFYHGDQEVGNTHHSIASLEKNKVNTFTWSKTTEPEVIDRVSCAITMSEGQGEDGWCYLELHYFKLTWNC